MRNLLIDPFYVHLVGIPNWSAHLHSLDVANVLIKLHFLNTKDES